MYGACFRRGAIVGTLLGIAAVAVAEESGSGSGSLANPADPLAATRQAAPGARGGEPIPPFMIPGQLSLAPEYRRQIRQSIERTNVEQQPVPRAFAPAAGQTAPGELKLTSLPQDVQQIPGITKHHQFARLEGGTILIVGDDRLVAAMIGPDER